MGKRQENINEKFLSLFCENKLDTMLDKYTGNCYVCLDETGKVIEGAPLSNEPETECPIALVCIDRVLMFTLTGKRNVMLFEEANKRKGYYGQIKRLRDIDGYPNAKMLESAYEMYFSEKSLRPYELDVFEKTNFIFNDPYSGNNYVIFKNSEPFERTLLYNTSYLKLADRIGLTPSRYGFLGGESSPIYLCDKGDYIRGILCNAFPHAYERQAFDLFNKDEVFRLNQTIQEETK